MTCTQVDKAFQCELTCCEHRDVKTSTQKKHGNIQYELPSFDSDDDSICDDNTS